MRLGPVVYLYFIIIIHPMDFLYFQRGLEVDHTVKCACGVV
jgi:hypothetical protein